MDMFNGQGINCGTTIIALEFKHGVVIAADSRTSCGNYVWSRLTDKLTPITDYIVCCRSGSAAQTQTLANTVKYAMEALEQNLGSPALVYDAAATFREQIYTNRNSLIASVIVAGWDREKGGQVYSIPITGLLVREHCAVAGSGSIFIQGYITAEYEEGMSEMDCLELVRKAIRLAIIHDSASGGVVRVGVITKDGLRTMVYTKAEDEMIEFTNKMLWTLEFGKW